jgi:hypothetical protein
MTCGTDKPLLYSADRETHRRIVGSAFVAIIILITMFGAAVISKFEQQPAQPSVAVLRAGIAYLTLQCHLGFPRESLRDQSDSIANFEISSRCRFLVHFPFAFAAALKVLIRYIVSPQNVPLHSIGDRREWDYGKPGRWLGFPNVDVLLFDSYSATQKRKPPRRLCVVHVSP